MYICVSSEYGVSSIRGVCKIEILTFVSKKIDVCR